MYGNVFSCLLLKISELNRIANFFVHIKANIYKLLIAFAEADGALDKARKHKKRQLEDTLNLVLKKRKVVQLYFLLQSFYSS